MDRREPSGPVAAPRGLVLLVDDEPAITKLYARILVSAGFLVEAFNDSRLAAERARARQFDAVLCDISMPRMDGLELLRSIREHDLDLPVVLMTGGPAVESAVKAMEYGALRYLIKPINAKALQEAVLRAVRLHRMARVRREALAAHDLDDSKQIGDRAGLEARFASALSTLWMAFQPIVSWSARTVFAYEALVRNEEDSLRSPVDLFDAAERLDRVHELGRAIRGRVAQAMVRPESPAVVFVNAHPVDLTDPELYSPDAPLSAHASRVVLEITERAALERIDDLVGRIRRLRAMGYRIALDDLGAGYAGLTTFAHLEPDVVKVDMTLVRDVDSSPTKQKLMESIISLCHDLKIQIVAEGVETERERNTLISLGGDLCQGYFFARPDRPFPKAKF